MSLLTQLAELRRAEAATGLAFDAATDKSVADLYRRALKARTGRSYRDVHDSGLQLIWSGITQGGTSHVAMDAAGAADFARRFPNLAAVRQV